MKNEDQNFSLSPEEQAALNALPRERMPAAAVENKIVQTLKAQGQLRLEPGMVAARWPRRVLLAGAAIACLFLGFMLGQRRSESSAPEAAQSLFVLFLYGGDATPAQADEQVREYGLWIHNLAQTGRLAQGEKLKGSGYVLQKISGQLQPFAQPLPQSANALGGYFIIAASSYEEALKIAEACPHLKYGGVIELREIDPT